MFREGCRRKERQTRTAGRKEGRKERESGWQRGTMENNSRRMFSRKINGGGTCPQLGLLRPSHGQYPQYPRRFSHQISLDKNTMDATIYRPPLIDHPSLSASSFKYIKKGFCQAARQPQGRKDGRKEGRTQRRTEGRGGERRTEGRKEKRTEGRTCVEHGRHNETNEEQ